MGSVIKNMMVRVGANASGFVKGMKEASSAGKELQKSSKKTKEAMKGYESPFRAAAKASAAYRAQIDAANRANAAAKERFATVSEELRKSKVAFDIVKRAAEGLSLKKSFADQRAGIEKELETVNEKLYSMAKSISHPSADGLVQFDDGTLLWVEDAQAQFDALERKSSALGDQLSLLDEAAAALGADFQRMSVAQAIDAVTNNVSRLDMEANTAKRDMQTMGDRAAQAMSKVSPKAVGAVAGIRQVKTNIKAVLRAGVQAGSKVSAAFKKIGTSATGGSSDIKGMLSSIRNLGVISLGVRIASGLFGKLRSALSFCLQENVALSNSVTLLKYQMAQSLAPAINLVAGLLEKLMPLATGVSSAISRVITATFGGISAGANEANAALGSLGSTYGFDQVTKAEVTSAGSLGTADSGMFSGVADKVISEINKLKGLFTAGDWAGIGKTFAGYFSGIIDSVASLDIGGKLADVLSGVSQFLNGFVEEIDWAKLGTTINEFMHNDIIDALIVPLKEIDWFNLAKSLGEGLSAIIEGIDWNAVSELANEAIQALLDSAGGLITGIAWGAVFDSITDSVCSAIEKIDILAILGKIATLVMSLAAQLPSIIAAHIRPVFNTIGSFLESIGLTGAGKTFKKIGDFISDLGDSMTEGIRKAANIWLEIFEKVINRIISGINKLIDGWNSISNLGSAFGIDLTVRRFDSVSLQRLAKGGIAVKPVTAQIGEAGREAVLPLENNTGWAEQVAGLISRSVGAVPLILQVYIGNRKVYDGAIDHINNITQATGQCPIYI